MTGAETTPAGRAGLLTRLWRWHRHRPPKVRVLHWVPVVALVAALGAWGVIELTDNACATGVEKREDDEDCTGVTDGSYHFFEELGPVSDRIREENERITAADDQVPEVTIALMIPMTPAETEPAERIQIVREVQGAYLAQHRANQADEPHPQIRLVLANPGREMARWREVSDQLAKMPRSDNLRAVFGFNLSVERTRRTIDYLTNDKGLAVVGGPITAEALANDREHPERYPGLAKMVPSNREQARALTNYLEVRPEETFLVEDTHEDDIYARSLRAAFREETRGTPFAPEQYDASEVIPNDFAQMVNNLCDSRATTVYFSGRPPALAQLISALGRRGCVDRHFRVVTVSGASTLALDPRMERNWAAFERGRGLTVEYATVTHEDAWTAGDPPPTGGSAADFRSLSELLHDAKLRAEVGKIGPTGLADGRTITTHDSALTAIAGIRNRMVGRDEVPGRESIAAAWPRLHGPQKVRGASGWICLNGYGTPYNKAVAIVRLDPDPAEHIRFQELAWPEGEPPARQCKAGPE